MDDRERLLSGDGRWSGVWIAGATGSLLQVQRIVLLPRLSVVGEVDG